MNNVLNIYIKSININSKYLLFYKAFKNSIYHSKFIYKKGLLLY